MLHTPRLTFAMSEQGDIPAVFATIHPRFCTPSVSIVTFTVMLVIFATIGSYPPGTHALRRYLVSLYTDRSSRHSLSFAESLQPWMHSAYRESRL
jgi:amino acid transporter